MLDLSKTSGSIHADWERALERRGTKIVRLLLRLFGGRDADLAFHNLVPESPHPPRSFVEGWLVARDSAVGKLGRRLLWPALLVIVALGVIGVAVGTGELDLSPIGWF